MTTDAGGSTHGSSDEGLRTPQWTPIEPLESPRRSSPFRSVIRVVGMVVGLCLLGWAVSIALSPSNRAGIDAVRHADWTLIAALVGLTIVAMVLNGIVFWASQPQPPRKVPMTDAVAGNILATFLGLLPFKISVLVRGLVHHRRNGVRFGELASWFAAIAAMSLATLIPMGLVTLWRRQIDVVWVVCAIGGVASAGTVGVVLGRLADRYPILRKLSVGADRIVRHPGVMAANLALRFLDVLLFSARFVVASRIAGDELSFSDALVLGSAYFVIVVLAPAGPLGFAEMGVTGLAALIGHSSGSVTVTALAITATSAATSATLSIPAAAWLRLDRVFGWRGVSSRRA